MSTTRPLSVSLSKPATGLKVTFGNEDRPLTIKTTAAATTISSLSDIDTSTPEAREAGATLVYDPETNTYRSEKVFNYDGEDVSLDGGDF